MSVQQTVRTFLLLAQRFGLPLFLADTAALTLLSHEAVRQRDRLVLESHCTFLCTGRPVVSFALFASAWKLEVSTKLIFGLIWFPFCIISVTLLNFYFCGQPAFLLVAEQKGFELLELRGDDPRLGSLDTLSGEQIPLHFLFRLHGYIIQVGGAEVMWRVLGFWCGVSSVTSVCCPGGVPVRAQWELPVERTITPQIKRGPKLCAVQTARLRTSRWSLQQVTHLKT